MSKKEYHEEHSCHTQNEYEKYKKRMNDAIKAEYEEYKKMSDAIEEFILKSPKFAGKIMRGMSLPKEAFDDLMEKVKNKEPISDRGLSSWTTCETTAYCFARKWHKEDIQVVHIMEIGTAWGTSIRNLSSFKSEDEVVVSARQRRIATGRIETIKYKGEDIVLIYEEELFE